MTKEFRTLRESDIGDYYDIRFSVTENRIHPHQVNLLDRELVLEQIRQGGGSICLVNGVKVGVCLPVFVEEPFIAALFVRPSHHGAGIGRELLSRALIWLETKGTTQVTLVTDPGSRADGFYQRLGWIRGGLDEYGCQVVFTRVLSR